MELKEIEEHYLLIRSKVEKFARERRRTKIAEETGLACSIVVGVVGTTLAIGLAPQLGAVVRAVLGGLAVIGALAGISLAMRAFFRKKPSLVREAITYEFLSGGWRDQISSSLSLFEEARERRTRGFSIDLTAVLLERTAERVKDVQPARVIPRKLLWKRAVIAGALILGFALWGALSPSSMGRSFREFISSYGEVMQILFPVSFEVSPGNKVILKGESVVLSARLVKGKAREATLHIKGQASRTLKAEASVFSLRLGSVSKSFNYAFEIGRTRSQEYTIRVTGRPVIERMEYGFRYPSYTRISPKRFRGFLSTVRCLEGTLVMVSLASSKELESAVLIFDGGEICPMNVGGRFASYTFRVSRNTGFRIRLKDTDGFESSKEGEPYVRVVAISDKPPEVALKLPKKEIFLTEKETGKFGFEVEAKDDYGVAELRLKYRVGVVEGVDLAREVREGTISKRLTTPRLFVKRVFSKVFEELGLRSGDKVTFWVIAKDNREGQPNESRTPLYSLVVYKPSLAKFAEQRDVTWVARYGADLGRKIQFMMMPVYTNRVEKGVVPEKREVKAFSHKEVWNLEFKPLIENYFRLLSEKEK